VACTGAELDAPQGGGLPYTSSCSPAPEDSPETFSSTTPFAAQYPIQEHGLLAGNDCLRRLHFLLVAAEGWSGAPEGREVLVRASTHPDAWTARLARRALVAARDSDAMAARAHDLTSGSSRVLLWSMLDLALARDAARAHVPAIIAAADRAGNAATKYVLPFVLGEIGGEEAITRLEHDLASPAVDVRAVIASLEMLADDAAPAADALRKVAEQHHVADVRERAARAYARITGEGIPARRPRCPREVKRLSDGWLVQLSTMSVRFAPTDWKAHDRKKDRRDRRSAAGRCAPLIDDDEGIYIAHPLGADCLVGINMGEFGGGVSIQNPRSDKRELLFGGNPKRFVDEGDGSVLVFEGLVHMTVVSGSVRRVRRQPNGKWVAERVAELEAHPLGWARDGEGRLLVLAREELPLTREQRTTCRADHPSYVVLRVWPDGRIEALE